MKSSRIGNLLQLFFTKLLNRITVKTLRPFENTIPMSKPSSFLYNVSKLFFVFCVFHIASDAFAETPSKIQIGVTIPLTGGFADWGLAFRRGIEMYTAKPDNRFAFDFQDEVQGDPKKAIAAYREYRLKGIRYMIQGSLAGTEAVIPLAAHEDVLLFSAGLSVDATVKKTDKLIGFGALVSTEINYLGKYIAQKGFKRIAILNRQDPFSEEIARLLRNRFTEDGLTVVLQESIDADEADFRSFVLRMKQARPDAFFFNVSQDKEGILVQQIRAQKLMLPIFSNYDFEAEAALPYASILQGVEYSFPLNTAEGSPGKIEFDKEYAAHFKTSKQPHANTYLIYDGLTLLDQAFSTCEPENVKCVAQFFKSTKSFTGLSGSMSYREDGSNVRPYGIKTIENGKFVWVKQSAQENTN